MFSRSCAGHTISTSGHQWSFWPGDRWRHVFGSRLHFYALSAIRIRRPSCYNVRAFPECSNDWLPRTHWNTHARWAAMLVSNHPILPCHWLFPVLIFYTSKEAVQFFLWNCNFCQLWKKYVFWKCNFSRQKKQYNFDTGTAIFTLFGKLCFAV